MHGMKMWYPARARAREREKAGVQIDVLRGSMDRQSVCPLAASEGKCV